MNFPLCRRCGGGELVPVSDYADGASLLYKAWSCNNESCGFTIAIKKGEVYRTVATLAISRASRR